jgi:hypothetical protein
MTIIQDATTPADTAAAIEAAGLGARVATLQPGQPLPTLGDLITAGRTLLVFAEIGGSGLPPWYHSAYQWFQETPYTFKSAADFVEKGNLVSTLRDINKAKVREVTKAKRERPMTHPSVCASPVEGSRAAPAPSVRAMPTVPPASVIKSLTAGNPDAFCAILPKAVRDIVAWAQAVLGADPGDAGVADLVYGPILARDVGT